MNRKILLTGLGPFGGYSKNLSEEIAKELNGILIKIGKTNFVIESVIIPNNFLTFRNKLEEAIISTEYFLVLGLGMDFKDSEKLSFEIVAHKKPKYELLEDNFGNKTQNELLDKLPNKLYHPFKNEMKKVLRNIEGIKISKNAGRWTCETILRDIIRLSNNGKKFFPAFIHLPHTKELLEESKKLQEHKKCLNKSKQKKIILNTIIKSLEFYLE